MKFPESGNSNESSFNRTTTNARFCEQYNFMESLFEQWNDCERTVVLCALLKRMTFSNLKFLQLSIEHNITQNFGSQTKYQVEEIDSNDPIFLNKLANKYKTFNKDVSNNSSSKDSLLYNSLSFASSSGNDEQYEKKQDILMDLLTYLPLLKPHNDEAKSVYMNLIPCTVEDSVKHIVPTDLVQQFFSYLLIHPAITSDDRRSLSHWLKHLQVHISMSSASTKKQATQDNSFNFLQVTDLQSPYLTSSTSSLSSASWQTTLGNLGAASQLPSGWDLHNIQVTQDFCDDFNDFPGKSNAGCNTSLTTQSSNTSSIIVGNKNQTPKITSSHLSQSSSSNNTNIGGSSEGGTDDHHVSFSKNGTEIIDFDYDDFKSNTQITFDLCGSDFLTVPGSSMANGVWDPSVVLKTRRSNSLTATSNHSNTCSSAENLSNIVQKPRSFSLSGESFRSNLTSHGSETRLDDMNKTNYIRITSHNVGMTGIGQWLKSLRLHKYVWLFTHLTYEKMLDITEEYLENLGVTKGARHKLVLCIQKLKERPLILHQMQKELITGMKQPYQMLEELTNIVMTPMKPVDMYDDEDVATLFFKVLDLICSIIASKHVCSKHDEDSINVVLWLLERSLHNEAFMAQTNQLKEQKYKLTKMKNQHFAPKGHYNKGGPNNLGLNKLRWNNNQKNKSGSSEGLKMHRKNSNNVQHFSTFSTSKNNSGLTNSQGMFYHHSNINNNKYSKSSSYPSFISSNMGVPTNNAVNTALQYNALGSHSPCHPMKDQQLQTHGIQAVVHAFNESCRHSISNLISVQQPFIKQQAIKVVSETAPQHDEKTVLNSNDINDEPENVTSHDKNTNSIGDINSRLEFLCLQMTEQAIN